MLKIKEKELIGRVVRNENYRILGKVIEVETVETYFETYDVLVLDSGMKIREMDVSNV